MSRSRVQLLDIWFSKRPSHDLSRPKSLGISPWCQRVMVGTMMA
ncbi:hypothetical protein A2U01_0083443, partial [Trifolium medium]|nr:hypothetical protein [Trifolium medium]